MKTIEEKARDILEGNITFRGTITKDNFSCVGIPYQVAMNAVIQAYKDGYAEALRWRDPEEDMCTLENEGKFILIKYRLIDDFHLIGDAFYNHTVYIKDRIARLPDGEYLRNNPVMVLYGWRPIE